MNANAVQAPPEDPPALTAGTVPAVALPRTRLQRSVGEPARGTGPGPLWQRCAVAAFTATLLFSRQIASYLDHTNRFYYAWRPRDAWALLFIVVLLAGAAVGLHSLLGRLRCPRGRRLFEHVFLLALAGGLMSLIPSHHAYPRWITIGWLGVVGVVGFSLGWPGSRLVRWARNVCLVFSPVVLILFAQLLTAGSWADAGDDRLSFAAGQVAGRRSGSAVVMIVFDAWPAALVLDGRGEFLPEYPNLRQLSRQACVFSNAQSPYHCTSQSLPRILYQNDDTLAIEPGRTVFQTAGGDVDSRTLPSLFAVARAHEYFTAMVGFNLPYRRLLGEQVHACVSRPFSPKARTLLGQMGLSMMWNFGYLTDPLSIGINARVNNRIWSRYVYQLTHQILEDTERLIRDGPPNTLCVVHVPLPHAPFIFRRDGSYRGPFDGNDGMYVADNNARKDQLGYVDTVVGRLMASLQAAGKFDDALVVLTSDHGWNGTPGIRHVPLVIKLPGQDATRRIDRPLVNNQLAGLIESVLGGNQSRASIPHEPGWSAPLQALWPAAGESGRP